MFSVETATGELLFKVAGMSPNQALVVAKSSTINVAGNRTEPILIRRGYTNWKTLAACRSEGGPPPVPVKRKRRQDHD